MIHMLCSCRHYLLAYSLLARCHVRIILGTLSSGILPYRKLSHGIYPPTVDYSTGGTSTGGTSIGGNPTGGNPTGGHPTGETPIGGYPTGGKPTGGYPAGYCPTGSTSSPTGRYSV